MLSHNLVNIGIHTLAFYMIPEVTAVALDTVLVVSDSCIAAATRVFGGSGLAQHHYFLFYNHK